MKKQSLSCLFLLASTALLPAGVIALSPTVARAERNVPVAVMATWYGHELAGNRTANGEIFNPNGLTAAHKTLPFGTRVRVTNPRTGRSVVVRINDRLGDPRIEIDLALGAARAIGMTETSRVQMEILGR